MLDGPSPNADYKEHQPAADSRTATARAEVIRRTRPVQKDCYACSEWNYDWFRNDLEEPYTTAPGHAVLVQGACRWWRADQRLGPQSIPLLRPGLQVRLP